MYVIGVDEFSFLNIKSKILMNSCKIWNEIDKVVYDCNLERSTMMPDYETAIKVIKEIKDRKDEILFENDSICGEILDRGKKFDVEKLKVYQLVVTEYDTKNL